MSGRSGFSTVTEQAKPKDANLMTVIKKPTGFYCFLNGFDCLLLGLQCATFIDPTEWILLLTFLKVT